MGGGGAVGRVGGGGGPGGAIWGGEGGGAQAPLTSPCPQSNHTITKMGKGDGKKFCRRLPYGQ